MGNSKCSARTSARVLSVYRPHMKAILLGVAQLAEDLRREPLHPRPDPPRLALSVAGHVHVQDSDLVLDDRGRSVQWPGRAARGDDVGDGTAGRDPQWGRPYAALAAIGRSPSQAAAVRYVLVGEGDERGTRSIRSQKS